MPLPERELPLFVVDPADKVRKHIGNKQYWADGSISWYKKVTSAQVMRLGSLGFDAFTYDTQFKGRPGMFRVIHDDDEWRCNFDAFELGAKEMDYGHGKQYFLGFEHWAKLRYDHPEVKPPHIEFGVQQLCPKCQGGRHRRECDRCNGAGVISR